DVGRGDAEQALVRLRPRLGLGLRFRGAAVEVPAQRVVQRGDLRRVTAARVRRCALAQRRELTLARAAQLRKTIVVQEAGVVQRRDEAARGVSDRDLPGQ